MALTQTAAPASYLAVTLAEAKRQLRMEETTADDTLISDVLIPAAYDRAELATQRQLFTATWALKLDAFPCADRIELPRPPLRSVTSVAYVDTNGDAQTWASSNYLSDAVATPITPRCQRGRLALAYGVSWPSTRSQINAVTITFSAGYGTATTDLPKLLRQAILLDLTRLYEHRDQVITGTIVAELPGGSRDIYRSYRSYPGTYAVWTD